MFSSTRTSAIASRLICCAIRLLDPDFVRHHAVDDDVAPVAAGAADVGHVGAEAHAERVDRVLVADARQQPHDRRDVATEHLDLLDLLRRDHAAMLGLLDVDLACRALPR